MERSNSYQKYVPYQIYHSSVQNPRNLARAIHMRDVKNLKIDSLSALTNLGAGDSSKKKNRASRNQQNVFYAERKDISQKNCPNKSAKKKQYLINSISENAPYIDLEGNDLKSVLSYNSDNNDAICCYSDYDNSSKLSPDEDDDCCFKITKMPR